VLLAMGNTRRGEFVPMLLEHMDHRSTAVGMASMRALSAFEHSAEYEQAISHLLLRHASPRVVSRSHASSSSRVEVVRHLLQMEPPRLLGKELLQTLVHEFLYTPQLSESEWQVCPARCQRHCTGAEHMRRACAKDCESQCTQSQDYQVTLAQLLVQQEKLGADIQSLLAAEEQHMDANPDLYEEQSTAIWMAHQEAPGQTNKASRRLMSQTLIDFKLAPKEKDWTKQLGNSDYGAYFSLTLSNSAYINLGWLGGGFGTNIADGLFFRVALFGITLNLIQVCHKPVRMMLGA
jgi:hypothetical protein